MFISLISQMLLGGLLSKVFGLIQTLQSFNLILMINVIYPGFLLVFIGYCVEAAEMDILSGSVWFEIWFNFRETEAYSQTFALFGMDNTNFMLLTSSLPLLFALILVY